MSAALTSVLSITILSCILSATAEGAQVITIRDENKDAAVVLVHGLQGNADTSFTNEVLDLSWPDLIMADARKLLRKRSLSEFDIYTVDYSDVFTNLDVNGVSIEEMTQQVSDALTSRGLLENYNHVWFIAHSLGGILIKRAIVRWSARRYDRYLHHILGVSLLGVPSNGAPLADLGVTTVGAFFKWWFGLDVRHVSDLRTIESANTYLGGLENDWSEFMFRRNNSLPRVSCAYETAGQYRVGSINIRIVPAIYTKSGCDGEARSVNKTHRDLPRPSGHNDYIEDWLFLSVRDAWLSLDRSGESIERANEPGTLWRKLRLINSGHGRLDPVGVSLVDQKVEWPEAATPILQNLKLSSQRYVGATWADVLDRVREDNTCIKVKVRDAARRDIFLAVEGYVACPTNQSSRPSWACNMSSC